MRSSADQNLTTANVEFCFHYRDPDKVHQTDIFPTKTFGNSKTISGKVSPLNNQPKDRCLGSEQTLQDTVIFA